MMISDSYTLKDPVDRTQATLPFNVFLIDLILCNEREPYVTYWLERMEPIEDEA